MKNKWFLRIAALVLLVVSFLVIKNIMEYKSPHGTNQMRAFYCQPKNTIDVLAMGSSHVHCGINTATLWNDYKIAAYDLSAAEQPLWITYYYLKEAYKYQKPKVVIIDVFSAARFKEDYHYKWMEESFYGMRFGREKIEMLKVAVEKDRYREYFPSFFSYHNRYIDLNKEDILNIFGNRKEKEIFKGYTPSFNRIDQSEPFSGWDELEDYSLTEKSEEYLKKIIDLTNENGSKLMIIVVPYNLDERDKETYKQIEEIADSCNFSFKDYNNHLSEIGIDKETDFNDHTHLNYWGSVKFTEYLGQDICNEAGDMDKQSVDRYESWNENAEAVFSEARKHQ